MPVYEYTCVKCREKFELLVRAETKIACPKCKSTKVKKEFSVFGAAGNGAKAAPSGGG